MAEILCKMGSPKPMLLSIVGKIVLSGQYPQYSGGTPQRSANRSLATPNCSKGVKCAALLYLARGWNYRIT
jgi:hypothetical protein